MIENAFTTKFACWITGEKHTEPPKRRYIKVAERHAASAADRTEKLTAFIKGGISIPSQEAEDRSKAVRGRRVGVGV